MVMYPGNKEVLERYVREAVAEVMAEYERSLEFCSNERQEEWIEDWPQMIYTSVIGFQGLHVHGSIIICCEREFLLETIPFRDQIPIDMMNLSIQDWLGELTNLLMGRISNRLLDHGLSVKISPPSVAIASPSIMNSYAERVPAYQPFWFALDDDQRICVQLGADLAKDINLGESTSDVGPVVRPGNTAFFNKEANRTLSPDSAVSGIGQFLGVSWGEGDHLVVEFDTGAHIGFFMGQVPQDQPVQFQFSNHRLEITRLAEGVDVSCDGMVMHLPFALNRAI